MIERAGAGNIKYLKESGKVKNVRNLYTAE